jgi:hypothetical protein
MAIAKRIFAWSVVDRCVRVGIAPRSGIGRSLFHWALENRDLHLPRTHPLYQIVRRSPFDSTYALSRGAMAWLWWRLHEVRPRCVLEMGSGRSTGMFSLYAQAERAKGRPAPVIVSLDHEEEWIGHTAALLRDLNTDSLVRLVLAPVSGDDETGRGYGITQAQLGEALGSHKVDLLLVDGPSGAVGRHKTLPLAMPLLAANADVFLDDAERESEAQNVAVWRREYPGRLDYLGILPLGRGLCWLKTPPMETVGVR